MKKGISFILIIAFILSPIILLSGCGGDKLGAAYDAGTPTSYITLNINPSVELVADDKGKVIAINAVNDDGGLLFYGTDYRGYNVEVVVREMVKVLAQTGYIDGSSEENAEAVFISVAGVTTAVKEDVYSKIRMTVNDFFEANGLFAIVAPTVLDNTIKNYAAQNAIADNEKFRVMLKAMEYNADLELTDVVDMNEAQLFNQIYLQVKNMASIKTQAQKTAYLDARIELKETLASDLVALFNNATYTQLYNELEVLKEEYRTADLSETAAIVEQIEDKEEQMAPLLTQLRTQFSSQVATREVLYNQDANALLTTHAQNSMSEIIDYDTLITQKRVEFQQYFELRQEYAKFNNFSLEYQTWEPLTTTEISAFLSTITTEVSSISTQTRQEVSHALARINPYTRSFGFGDSTGGTWTFP